MHRDMKPANILLTKNGTYKVKYYFIIIRLLISVWVDLLEILKSNKISQGLALLNMLLLKLCCIMKKLILQKQIYIQ